MSMGIVLVHGYTGSAKDLLPLAEKLSGHYGADSVVNLSLPFHDNDQLPGFDHQVFIKEIARVVDVFLAGKQKIVLFGHSTGGTLILAYMLNYGICPDLLVLTGVPRKITVQYLERWEQHSPGKPKPGFSSVARMVSLINSMGKKNFEGDFPVLIMNGQKDELVPTTEAFNWTENFKGEKRVVIIPDSAHHFSNEKTKLNFVSDLVVRGISDISSNLEKKSQKVLEHLIEIEPEAKSFLQNCPLSAHHLSRCPGGKKIIGAELEYPEFAVTEPVFANIEITTHCNLSCQYCARTRLGIKGQNMSLSMFSQILEILPHAYRITLVGLGEPLLHPDVAEFVKIAAQANRRVSLVTNALNLDKSMSKRLIESGLDSIVFSIDSPDQELAQRLRSGTDLKKLIENIKEFALLADGIRPISKAVFSALSLTSLPYLEQLIDLVAELGVHVLMLSDLNFKENLNKSLWKNMDDAKAMQIKKAVGYSFSKGLPILSVHGLEEFGLRQRYMQFLPVPPSKLYKRSQTHTSCLSPWQTIPVNVKGDVAICDCQPEKIIGNLFSDPFSDIWNGRMMKTYRRQMTGQSPAQSCRICPRF
ncbi:MAG: alpha/beta fold hydrolase [Desulfobacteraceae bacterium]|nr:alpha/beta fold hydrolase [Desulfobacteraceae bacterium]